MGDDGLIQRFGLLVWPDISPSWHDVDRCQNIDARREAHRVFEMLNGLDAECVGAQKGEFDSIPYLRFDTEGLELFREWREGWEAKLRSGDLHPALESHLAKYRKLVPGLALILHLANDMTGPVGKKATLQALAWAEYLETHARRAYASVTSLDVAAAKAILKKVRCGELSHSFATRDVYRKGWAHLSDREHVEEALQLLTDHNWVRMSRQDTEGRTATMYTVNPRGLKT
jgi:putative DNA primase/helicase